MLKIICADSRQSLRKTPTKIMEKDHQRNDLGSKLYPPIILKIIVMWRTTFYMAGVIIPNPNILYLTLVFCILPLYLMFFCICRRLRLQLGRHSSTLLSQSMMMTNQNRKKKWRLFLPLLKVDLPLGTNIKVTVIVI